MQISDHSVGTPRGRLFARCWLPDHGEAGRRATILLLHDSIGCVALWRDFPERLATATGRRVVAYDRLGFGRSDPHPGALPDDFIRAEASASVPALAETLGLGRLVPFGHSVGGGMAVGIAAELPDHCEAVVTVASQAFVEDRTVAGIREARQGFADPLQLERLARHHGDKTRWALDAWIETWLSPDFAGWTLEEGLRRIRCPLLAIHGDRDEYGSTEHPRRIGALAGGPARVVILHDCGHVPHRERPDALLDAAVPFLASTPRA